MRGEEEQGDEGYFRQGFWSPLPYKEQGVRLGDKAVRARELMIILHSVFGPHHLVRSKGKGSEGTTVSKKSKGVREQR